MKNGLAGPVEEAIIQELRQGPRTIAQLHKRLYGHCEDGGADEVSIQKTISKLRNCGVRIDRVSVYSLG